MKNFKYSILKDFILVIRQSDGTAVAGVNVTGAAIRLVVPVVSKE
jgi:hypothetical protein